ncbi:MAG: TonB-dependent receptor [Chromatocurvus sp.]
MHDKNKILALSAAVAASFGMPGWAQTGAPAKGATAIEEVIVTSRKREESIQDIPVSVSAMDLTQIERQGISSLEDVAKFTASLTWSEGLSPWDSKPAIRGQTSVRAASEPTTSIFVDGNLVPWRSGLNLQNLAIERIEVVKGPQSAMFGRGVLSGAVNYITRRPGDEFGGWVEAEAGQRGRRQLSGWLDLPASDALSFGVSGRWLDFEDGLFDNTLTGRDGVGAQEVKAGALSMLYDDGGNFRAYVRASYSDEYVGQPAYHTQPSNQQVGPSPFNVWYRGEVPVDEDLISHNCDSCEGNKREVTWFTANLDWDVGAGTISSQSGFNRTEGIFDLDIDYMGLSEADTPVGFLQNNLRQFIGRDIDTFSQELRYTSRQDRPVRWMVGLYYYDEQVDEEGASVLGTVLTPDDIPKTEQTYDISAYAAFGAVEWDVSEQLTAGLELRRSYEEQEVDFTFGGTPESLDDSWTAWLPRASLDYRVNDDLMLYAAIAAGTKPGGFNTALGAGSVELPRELLPFDEELAVSYELGIKSEWLDRRLVFNAAVFYTDWEDVQVNAVFVPPPPQVGQVGYTANAGKARVPGAEFDFAWRASASLDIRGGYSYTPARIKDALETRLAGTDVDLSGYRRMPYSSDHNANLSATWTRDFGNQMSGFVQADARYRSTQYATIGELAETGDRTVVDLRVGVTTRHWDVTAAITNLFDDDTPLSVSPFVNPQTFARNFIVYVPPQRLWNLRARYRF